MNSINRCYDDADQSRLDLALERIRDLHEEFPDDASVIYAHGILLRDHLGIGLEAGALFARAFGAAAAGEKVHRMAPFNAAGLARDIGELRHWAAEARHVQPDDDAVPQLNELLQEADRPDFDYFAYLADRSAMIAQRGDLADAAAVAEIALAGGCSRLRFEVSLRLNRAIWLRQLDTQAARARENLLEAFSPAERLNLQFALQELERAVALDEFSAEQWNYRAAWSFLLGKSEDAITFADKAIALRPQGYIKPWINKANGLWRLKRYDEARECARQAMAHAHDQEDAKDRDYAEEMCKRPEPRNPDDAGILAWLEGFLHNASIVAQRDAPGGGGRGGINRLAKNLRGRVKGWGDEWDPAYVHIMSQMLTFFRPELVAFALVEIRRRSPKIHEHSLCAGLYVLAHAEGVMRRDAARCLSLYVLAPLDLAETRRLYRKLVLEPAAADDEFGSVETSVRTELAAINPSLVNAIAAQVPVDAAGRDCARQALLWRFTPDNMIARAPHPARYRFAGAVALVMLLLGGANYAFWGSASSMLSLISEHSAEIAGVVVLCVIVVSFIVSRARRAARQTSCARCGRAFVKVRPPAYMNDGAVIMSAARMRDGSEGLGRECVACGRTYCSDHPPPNLQCDCGRRPLTQVRLLYRPRA